MSGPSAWAAETISVAIKTPAVALYNLLMSSNYAARESRYNLCTRWAKLMRTWLRSLVNAILGKVPGKTSRLDTATRMAMDADFSDRRERPGEARSTFVRIPERKRTLKEQK